MQFVECSKCKKLSGDDWSQCGGSCPKEGSPHYSREAYDMYGPSLTIELTESEAARKERIANEVLWIEEDEEPRF